MSKTSNERAVERNSAKRPYATGNRNAKRGQSQKNSKAKRPVRKEESRESDKTHEARTDALSSLNDVNWYNHNPELLQAAGRVAFPNKPGMTLDLGTMYDSATGKAVHTGMTIPGVMAIKFQPSIGYSDSVTSPASIAAMELYTKVRSQFSGALDENAPDIMMYLMALDSIFSYLGWMKRVYRTVSTYTPQNFQVPNAVLRAMDFQDADINDLRTNKIQFWQLINELISKTRKFVCPAVMDIFNRHYWMNDNVYMDAPYMASQMYIFNQTHFFKFVDNTETGGKLAMTQGPTTRTVKGLYEFGDQLIQALAEWDDAYTIAGHLAKAFDGAPLFMVAPIAQDEIIAPVYVEEVLMQIENVACVPKGVGNADITQDPLTNSLIHKPTTRVGKTVSPIVITEPILNIHSADVSVEDVVVASRLTATYRRNEALDAGVDWFFDIIAGTEIVTGFTLHSEGKFAYHQSFTSYYGLDLRSDDTKASVNKATLDGIFRCFSLLSHFNHHPLLQLYTLSGSAANPTYYVKLYGNIANIASIDKSAMENLNRVCVYSEFNAFSR